jgi:hypothetical protein
VLKKKKLIDIGFRFCSSIGLEILFLDGFFPFLRGLRTLDVFEGLILGQSTCTKSISTAGCAQEQYCVVLKAWFLLVLT